ncbi:hypothetical protein B0H66DRAFT_619281 [Apodospora peruviana]|uniref:Uncharacterized protein n=1 Tax=Apodospora peruviana TaxID=516989 RepID=A0AAE0M818_9PEZI|nr:hypothetical protein B0H66DRAFT_619281 [Apodospora peruviana]
MKQLNVILNGHIDMQGTFGKLTFPMPVGRLPTQFWPSPIFPNPEALQFRQSNTYIRIQATAKPQDIFTTTLRDQRLTIAFFPIPKKLTKVIALSIAALVPVEATEWNCQFVGGGAGHAALKADHETFNRLFGGPRLTARSGQCYVSICNRRALAWCNTSGTTRTEYANERNVMADADPLTRNNCTWDDGGFWTGYF